MKALVAKRIVVCASVIVLRFRVESDFVQLCSLAALLPFATAVAARTAAALAPRAARHNDSYTNASGGGATAAVTHSCGMDWRLVNVLTLHGCTSRREGKCVACNPGGGRGRLRKGRNSSFTMGDYKKETDYFRQTCFEGSTCLEPTDVVLPCQATYAFAALGRQSTLRAVWRRKCPHDAFVRCLAQPRETTFVPIVI
jgi:hypothetical protein